MKKDERTGKDALPQTPKPAKGQPAAGANQRLADQNRKLLGKHYAARYGKRKGQ